MNGSWAMTVGNLVRAGDGVLDDSKVRPLARALAETTFARASLSYHPPGQRISAHEHEHPYLSIHLLGGYRERSEGGAVSIASPCLALHWPGFAHEDEIGAAGLEALVIDFDRDWLAHGGGLAPSPSRYWIGGRVGRAAGRLARAFIARPGLGWIHQAVALAGHAVRAESPPAPAAWLKDAARRFDAGEPARAIAARAGLHPEHVATALRAHFGEGLAERARRRRVERALSLMRGSRASLAEIALAAGFCDQSHLTRAFRATLGRTPGQARRSALGAPTVSAPAGRRE